MPISKKKYVLRLLKNAAAVIILGLLLQGCAFLNRDNTPLLNGVEKHLVPEKTWQKAVAFPLIFPVGICAITLDAFIVHPISVADEAYDDTMDTLWKRLNWKDEYMTECFLLPWRTISTPIVFTGDFLGRAMFDIPDRSSKIKREAKTKDLIVELEQLLSEKKYSEVINKLNKSSEHSYSMYDPDNKMDYIKFKAAYLGGLYDSYTAIFIRKFSLSKFKDDVKGILNELQKSENPYSRWKGLEGDIYLNSDKSSRVEYIIEKYNDPDPGVRLMLLNMINMIATDDIRDFTSDIEKLKEKETEPMNKAILESILFNMPYPKTASPMTCPF